MFTLATGRKARPDDQDRAGLPTYPHFSTFVHNFGFLRMLCVMARMAQRHKVFRIIRAFRMIFQMLNVMNLCSLPLPAVSPAVLAHVFISAEDPLPHYLPARSLVKIVVFVIECHSFLHSKADHRSDGPPLFLFHFSQLSLYMSILHMSMLSCVVIDSDIVCRMPAVPLRAYVLSCQTNIPYCTQWPQIVHRRYTSVSAVRYD